MRMAAGDLARSASECCFWLERDDTRPPEIIQKIVQIPTDSS
jgi:hypothetical protein